MKFLVVVLVLAIAFFAWRSGRKEQRSAQRAAPPRQPEAIAQDMVACAHCGVHLPVAEAVHGRRAVYCGTEHLQRAGDLPR
jgi:uncharacterized protein